jgi:hypothetical protein
VWFIGGELPDNSFGGDGDLYYNNVSGDVYYMDYDEWVYLSNLRGIDGIDGQDGEDGLTPYIGGNGNWWIGETDTGIKAQGLAGADGTDGADGLTPYIGGNGNWWIGETDTGVNAQGQDGVDGIDGQDGVDGIDGQDGLTPYIGGNGNWYIGDVDTGYKAVNTSKKLIENEDYLTDFSNNNEFFVLFVDGSVPYNPDILFNVNDVDSVEYYMNSFIDLGNYDYKVYLDFTFDFGGANVSYNYTFYDVFELINFTGQFSEETLSDGSKNVRTLYNVRRGTYGFAKGVTVYYRMMGSSIVLYDADGQFMVNYGIIIFNFDYYDNDNIITPGDFNVTINDMVIVRT